MSEDVKVYMLRDDSSRGLRYSAGQIYSVEPHIADEMTTNRVAKVLSYPSLANIDVEIEKLTEALRTSIETVDDDLKLSDHGKSVKKQELLAATQEQIGALGERYNLELTKLKQQAQREAATNERTKDYDADQVQENVGILLSEVLMSPSFTQAYEAVQQQLNFMDQPTARRLLSQFPEIKKALDEKGASITSSDRYIRDLYQKVKEAATNEQQASSSLDYRILETIEQNRNFNGHYPTDFPRIK